MYKRQVGCVWVEAFPVEIGQTFLLIARTKLSLNTSASTTATVTAILKAQIGSGSETSLESETHRQVDRNIAEDRYVDIVTFYTAQAAGDLTLKLKLISSQGSNQASNSQVFAVRIWGYDLN